MYRVRCTATDRQQGCDAAVTATASGQWAGSVHPRRSSRGVSDGGETARQVGLMTVAHTPQAVRKSCAKTGGCRREIAIADDARQMLGSRFIPLLPNRFAGVGASSSCLPPSSLVDCGATTVRGLCPCGGCCCAECRRVVEEVHVCTPPDRCFAPPRHRGRFARARRCSCRQCPSPRWR